MWHLINNQLSSIENRLSRTLQLCLSLDIEKWHFIGFPPKNIVIAFIVFLVNAIHTVDTCVCTKTERRVGEIMLRVVRRKSLRRVIPGSRERHASVNLMNE